MFKKILIAIDDTPAAIQAADYGIALGKSLEAQIGIIYVTEYSAGNIDAGITPTEAEKTIQQRHDALLDDIEITHPDIDIKEFDPIGTVSTEIEKTIALWHADLLVMGHHTHSFFQKILTQSLEEKISDHLSVPLLIVPEKFK